MNGAVDRLFGSWKSCKVLISLLAGFFLLLALCAPIAVQAQPPSEGPQIPEQVQQPSDRDAKGTRMPVQAQQASDRDAKGPQVPVQVQPPRDRDFVDEVRQEDAVPTPMPHHCEPHLWHHNLG